MSDEVDLLVIGGGTAGIVGSKTAASLGARVLLVESDRTGGDCLWTGCVPSKSMLAAASAAAEARSAARFGVDVGEVRVDFARVRAHVKGAIAHIEPEDSPDTLRAAGVEVVAGRAELTGPGTARVGDRSVRFGAALLAVGASPSVPPVPGLREADPLTSETVWDVEELPRRVVVLGGGAIGSELAQAFARLGSSVALVEGAARILPNEDPEASALVTAALRRDGVDVRTGVPADRVEDGVLVLGDGARLPYDRLVVAVGRRARTEGLGGAAAGVELREDGTVAVDDTLRTTNPRIAAAGDVSGHPQFTHLAGVHASLAVTNLLLGLRRRVDGVVPRVTYTSPEVATVGVTPEEGRERGLTVVRFGHDSVDRAVAEGATDGFTSLVLDRRGRVLGGTVVGPRAGETLGELTLAVRRGLTAGDLAGTTHAYPTWNDGLWNAAIGHVRGRLTSAPAGPLLRAVVRLRGRRAQRNSR
jgi:pyruvate/2-oxoglutarate dehydrogenase complex dihydrolipoamide dehydrogenase (E3) component